MININLGTWIERGMRCTCLIGIRNKFDSTGLKSKDDRAAIALYNYGQDDEAPSCGTWEEKRYFSAINKTAEDTKEKLQTEH